MTSETSNDYVCICIEKNVNSDNNCGNDAVSNVSNFVSTTGWYIYGYGYLVASAVGIVESPLETTLKNVSKTIC